MSSVAAPTHSRLGTFNLNIFELAYSEVKPYTWLIIRATRFASLSACISEAHDAGPNINMHSFCLQDSDMKDLIARLRAALLDMHGYTSELSAVL